MSAPRPILKCYEIDLDSPSLPPQPPPVPRAPLPPLPRGYPPGGEARRGQQSTPSTPSSTSHYSKPVILPTPTTPYKSSFPEFKPFATHATPTSTSSSASPLSQCPSWRSSFTSSNPSPQQLKVHPVVPSHKSSSFSKSRTYAAPYTPPSQPAPVIQDIVPLDNLGTLERKSKEPPSKPWYSTNLDSTLASATLAPTPNSMTLPRSFPRIPATTSSTHPSTEASRNDPFSWQSANINRSRSFKDSPLQNPYNPKHYDPDTIIEVTSEKTPPPKPSRSFMQLTPRDASQPSSQRSDLHSANSPEDFLRAKTLYSVPTLDLNNNCDGGGGVIESKDKGRGHPCSSDGDSNIRVAKLTPMISQISPFNSVATPCSTRPAYSSSTLPGQSIKTNLPRLPEFPATGPSTTSFLEHDQKVNDIKPVEMRWKPTAGVKVDERDKASRTRSLKRKVVTDWLRSRVLLREFRKDHVVDSEFACEDQGYEWIFEDKLRSSLVLRQQPALRVKAIVDKLVNMSGRDQRRALFALKQIFQDDKDLVHEFVQSDGLDCLIRLGKVSDQNHQNYILRALGQLMLYVDGMNGIIAHNETIQWLYELLDSPLFEKEEFRELSPHRQEWYRLVVKTALKLLLVFVEYTEANSLLLLAAIRRVERPKQKSDWSSIIRILSERGAGDDEMLVFAMTIVNKTLIGVPDQDTFFDVVDTLESQGFEVIVKNMQKMDNLQLNQQISLYERELKKEDATLEDSDSSEDKNASSESAVKMRVNGVNGITNNLQRTELTSSDRRTNMRRRQLEAEDLQRFNKNLNKISQQFEPKDVDQGYGSISNGSLHNGYSREPAVMETPVNDWKQPETLHHPQPSPSSSNSSDNENKYIENNNHLKSEAKLGPIPQKIKLIDRPEEKENRVEDPKDVIAPPPSMPNIFSPTEAKRMDFASVEPPPPPPEPARTAKPAKDDSDDEQATNCFAAVLLKRAQKVDRSKFTENPKSEADIKWKEASERLKDKPMIINDLDFSEFVDYEQDPLVLVRNAQYEQEKMGNSFSGVGIPPAPPPAPNGRGGVPPPPPLLGNKGRESSVLDKMSTSTVKLHWKPAQSDAPPIPMLKRKGTFWNKIETGPSIDTSKLARLFEQKAKEVPVKKPGEVTSKPQVLQVLSLKRSQAINIGLTKLPPITVIPTAIRKFDTTVLNKEGIEKILQTMMPHEEEIAKIMEKQYENPDMPLGQAEQFMLSLNEIDCLLERLKLWLFMLDYQTIEKDVAESLMELNNAMKEVEDSETFKAAMGMLLSIGNALNGTDIKAFQLEYLSKASEVKDPVYKNPLTYHLAECMLDNYPIGTDLHGEFGAASRSSKIDFDAVQENLRKMESDCKNCWNYVSKISQKDNNSNMKNKINNYLTEVAERIHRLKHVHRTTTNRWNAFLLYFGYAPTEIKEQKPMKVFKMVNEFALEYRTNREKILQMRKRLAEKRERNKTRGMMIGVAQKQAQQSTIADLKKPDAMTDQERHMAMSQMLSGQKEDTLNRRRGQPTPERTLIVAQTEALRKSPADTDTCDDELLDGVVRTVTAATDSRAHERRRARQFNRKSLRRTRTIRSDQIDAIMSSY